MYLFRRFWLGFIALLLPLSTLAAPAPVRDIGFVIQEDRSVVVTWNPIEDAEYYLVYYGSDSILGGDGEYDDYDRTDSSEPMFTFVTLPSNPLFVSVVAVDSEGNPGEFFGEEIEIELEESMPEVPDTSPPEEESTGPFLEPQVSDNPDEPALMPSEPSAESESTSSTGTTVADPTQVLELEDDTTAPTGPQYLERAPGDTDAKPQERTLHLLSAEATSPTTVELRFSHPIIINREDAPDAFAIVKANGQELPITQLSIQAGDATLTTAKQERSVVYEVRLSDPLQGRPDLPLDPVNRSAFFTGHPEGSAQQPQAQEQSSSVAQTPPPAAPPTGPEVGTYRLQAAPQPNGLYAVSATWVPPQLPGGLQQYLVSQSLDGGRSFGPPATLPGSLGGVELQGVQPGHFGLLVQTVDGQGTVSNGIFRSMTLPIPGGTSSPPAVQPPVGSVTPPPPQQPQQPLPRPTTTPLPQSGAATAGAIALSGAAVGWWRSRKAVAA